MVKLFFQFILGIGFLYPLVGGESLIWEVNIFLTTSVILTSAVYSWFYKKIKEVAICVLTYSFILNLILAFKSKELLMLSTKLNLLVTVIAFICEIRGRIKRKNNKRKKNT